MTTNADTEDLDLTMAVAEWVKVTARKAMAEGMDEEHAVQFAVSALADMLDKAYCVVAALALKEGPDLGQDWRGHLRPITNLAKDN